MLVWYEADFPSLSSEINLGLKHEGLLNFIRREAGEKLVEDLGEIMEARQKDLNEGRVS